jgi:hypothetical protein
VVGAGHVGSLVITKGAGVGAVGIIVGMGLAEIVPGKSNGAKVGAGVGSGVTHAVRSTFVL